MASRDSCIRALAKKLGKEYRVTFMDFEHVVYRDFGNGYNVEISGMYTTSKNKRATLYLWNGETIGARVVKIVSDVAQDDIGKEAEKLYEYSKSLIERGNNNKEENE